MKSLTIAVDVDQVVAHLNPAWYGLYNQDYNDTLTETQVTDWDVEKFVKPECGTKIHDYLKRPDLYNYVKPIDKALWGVNYLRDLGHRIVFASSCYIGMEKYKLDWLLEHGFLKLKPGAYTCKDWFPVSDKSLINADILIDDRPLYIQTFKGVGIIFDQLYNQNVLADARMKHWSQIPDIMGDLYATMFNDSEWRLYV